MRLPVQLVEDPVGDSQLNFEALQGVLTSPGTTLPFLQILSDAQVAVSYGTLSLTWTASTTSASKNISHGLGRTPQCVLTQPISNFDVSTLVSSPGASTFTIQGGTTNGSSISATATFYWLAIG